MSKLPRGWETKPLANLLEKIIDYRGISIPKAESGIPLITAKNVRPGYLELSPQEFIASEEYDNWMSRGLPIPGDILFTTEAPLGNACRYPSTGKFAVGQRTVTLRTKKESISSEYLLYFILSSKGQLLIDLRSSGSTAKGIKSSELKKVEITFPSDTKEQTKIAKILSTWDKAIATTERLLANSQQQKQALMQQLLTGQKRFAGFTEDWKHYALGQLFSERNETNRPDLSLLSITTEQGVIDRADSGKKDTSSEDKSKYRRICPGDIGYNTMRMWQGVSGLSDKEGIVSPAYTILQPTGLVDSKFASYLFKTPALIHVFMRHSQGLVSDTWNLKYEHFAKIKVSVPCVTEQHKIAQVLSIADAEIANLQAQLAKLRQEKKALMQQLLTGQRRVKLDDEAATPIRRVG